MGYHHIPPVFLWSARLLPVAIAGQFLLAGRALFGGGGWSDHATLGTLIIVPVLLLVGYVAALHRLRGLRWWAAVIAILYLLQASLAQAGTAGLSLHPFNGALLLASAMIVAAKVERRRARL